MHENFFERMSKQQEEPHRIDRVTLTKPNNASDKPELIVNYFKDSINEQQDKKKKWTIRKTIRNLNKIAANLQYKLKLKQDIIEIRTIACIIAEWNGLNY